MQILWYATPIEWRLLNDFFSAHFIRERSVVEYNTKEK